MSEKDILEIFFSYGHDEHAKVVKRLADEIEILSEGRVKAWINHKNIHRDAHWRRAISEGIRNCMVYLRFFQSIRWRKTECALMKLPLQ